MATTPPEHNRLYEGLFLSPEELPGLAQTQSTHGGPDPDDLCFEREGGRAGGFHVWSALKEDQLRRIVDIRWLFPTPAAARRYHRIRFAANAEGLPLLPDRPSIGEGARLLGGTPPMAASLGLDADDSTMGIALFVIGPVVVKVFVSGVPLADLSLVARRAERRVNAALATYPQPPVPTPTPRNVSERWPKGELAYEEVLAGRPLLAGRGIGDVLTFDGGVPQMYQAIGGGEEDVRTPFLYTFPHGSFLIDVQGAYRPERRAFGISRIGILDDPFGVLRTTEGIGIGTDVAKVELLLGAPDIRQGKAATYRTGIRFDAGADGRVERIDLIAPSPSDSGADLRPKDPPDP